jgi:hypothetical protein
MSNNFGFIDIILLAMIAGFIILRLRNILGRRTGHEGKNPSVFDEKNIPNSSQRQKLTQFQKISWKKMKKKIF